MGRILGLLRLFRRDIIVMLMALKERDTPGKVKGLLVLSILYLISPIDIIPDAVPFFGFLDDAVIVPTAICGLMQLLPPHVRSRSEQQADYVLRHAKLFGALVTVFVICWAVLLVWGIYKLIA
ncbi:YkvA family protein [Mitsuokella sp. AF33-22]|uniref:YkvA family protein n=1 Tax=Mitsuokella sp. AF33-22 TaxID=2292047 RepID=UPI000E46C5CE|nr:DUF1232 domain-containing protein [Mitsuokella sp. AF33-22]RHM55370.1 DUF1232 domain-containing protein [Mitsuokella sp. AF33-22]